MPRPKLKRPRPPKEPKPPVDDSFGHLCFELRKDLHMTQAQLGEWFAVSGKTFARWEDRDAAPTTLQAPGVIEVMKIHAPEYAERARLLLGVAPPAATATAPAAPVRVAASPAIAKAALEGALFEAAERYGIASARAREVALLLFERAALLDLGVREAAALLHGEAR
jgi:DNA-binding XRE family transcriptional regulator